jgi:methylthioribose-1-phosphate isomerase
MRKSRSTGTQKFAVELFKVCELMASTRPTAVNLFWAIERMKRSMAAGAEAGESVDQIKDRLDREAQAIHDEDVASCRAMGMFGASVVPDGARILTHCNAGALATAGYGTALGVIRGAVEAGKRVTVLADETRPFLQGARLTAWELVRDGIETTVITDNMAGAIMQQGQVDLVVVGADRIAANGDTANKIGTYSVAVLAREHDIPFYVAAPLSTIDLTTPDGGHIPIEERSAREVTHLGGSQLTPDGVRIRNPAFDVTPHRFITGIITGRRGARARLPPAHPRHLWRRRVCARRGASHVDRPRRDRRDPGPRPGRLPSRRYLLREGRVGRVRVAARRRAPSRGPHRVARAAERRAAVARRRAGRVRRTHQSLPRRAAWQLHAPEPDA